MLYFGSHHKVCDIASLLVWGCPCQLRYHWRWMGLPIFLGLVLSFLKKKKSLSPACQGLITSCAAVSDISRFVLCAAKC